MTAVNISCFTVTVTHIESYIAVVPTHYFKFSDYSMEPWQGFAIRLKTFWLQLTKVVSPDFIAWTEVIQNVSDFFRDSEGKDSGEDYISF